MSKSDSEELERLRAAFSATTAESSAGTEVDADRIWMAVRGELPASEIEELADRAGRCPEIAAAWRLAVECSRQLDATGPAPVVQISDHRPRRWFIGLAAAAIVVVGLAGVLYRSTIPTTSPTLRAAAESEIENEVSSSGALPRDDFVLRWSGAPEGSIYEIVLTDASLAVLDQAAFLEHAEYRVPEEVLADLDDGAEVWWRVEATKPEGSTVVSRTFVTPVK